MLRQLARTRPSPCSTSRTGWRRCSPSRDRVTITRNGRDVLTKDRADLTIPEVIEGMIGVQHEALFPPPLPPTAGRADDRIVVKGLSGGPLDERRPHRTRPARWSALPGSKAPARRRFSRFFRHAEGRGRRGRPFPTRAACRGARPTRRAAASAWSRPTGDGTA